MDHCNKRRSKQKKFINRGKGFNANYSTENGNYHTNKYQQRGRGQKRGGGYRSYHTANHSFGSNLDKTPYQRQNNQRRPNKRQYPSFRNNNSNLNKTPYQRQNN